MAQVQREPRGAMPPQEQAKPGIESKMTPRPRYKAPLYKGSGKLKNKVALIAGGDSGIGRSVAVLYARQGADVAIVYLAVEQSDAEEMKKAVEKEGDVRLSQCPRPCPSGGESPSCPAPESDSSGGRANRQDVKPAGDPAHGRTEQFQWSGGRARRRRRTRDGPEQWTQRREGSA